MQSTSTGAGSGWTLERLEQRIFEGHKLLTELGPTSGWAPIVSRRIEVLRNRLGTGVDTPGHPASMPVRAPANAHG